MQQDIRNIEVFEKLATVSRENSIFELLWHLGIEISSAKTVINVLFRNVTSGEYITDEIAPECIGYCSVGSFFKCGKKLESRTPNGVIRDIIINVEENVIFPNVGSAIRDAEYNLNYVYKTKDGRNSTFFGDLCKKQKCMEFKNGTDKVVIPCSVIAAKYYMTSSSMRIQLLAQNLHGLYEDIQFDPSTQTARIILHRNAKKEDAIRIARFARSQHAALCWDNIMNSIRSAPSFKCGTPLSAKIPVVQQNLAIQVRCHEAPNFEGGTTTLVHEIREERSELPFKALLWGYRPNAPLGPDPFVISEIDAESGDILTNSSPSSAFKGKRISQFNVSNNSIWNEIEFIQIQLPAHGEAHAITVTEKDYNDALSLSLQRAIGNDLNNRVAGASLDPSSPLSNLKQRMALTEFREMVSGFAIMEGVTDLCCSSDLEVPCKDPLSRRNLTLLESYDKKRWNRRHYMYVSFKYNRKFVCLVEIDLTGLKKQIGTYILLSAYYLGKTVAQQVADNFVHNLKFDKMLENWLLQGVTFKSKSHPSKQTLELLKGWRMLVLEKFV